MNLKEFDFDLPAQLIATEPFEPRDHSRLLIADRKNSELTHRNFFELPYFLNSGDLLVLNNTKVFPARLFGNDLAGREFEIFLLEKILTDPSFWKCMARPGKKVKEKISLTFPLGVTADVESTKGDSYTIRFKNFDNDFFTWLSFVGKMPLPPYIKREATDKDRVTYQTVYAKENGSIAAPTAGLHFTPELLYTLKDRGVRIAEITLHVGYGTFAPIRSEEIDNHSMHEEEFFIPDTVITKMKETRASGGRVIAVGTTTLRALESFPQVGNSGKTDIFIRPGYEFKMIDGLITNFHVPKSSLFILVSSLMGQEFAHKAYAEAILKAYRFYSYGDAMFIL